MWLWPGRCRCGTWRGPAQRRGSALEGISKVPGTKGDLRIRFGVQFPRALPEQQKAGLRKLPPSD